MHSEWWRFETKLGISIRDFLIDLAPIAGGVTSEATTADGAGRDLASLCLKARWLPVSHFIETSTGLLKKTERDFVSCPRG